MRILFADDLLLLAPYNSTQDRNKVQDSIDDICHTVSNLQMKLNDTKCCCMTLNEGRMPFVPEQPLTVAESQLSDAQGELAYLGVIFDCKLSWSENTRKLVTKAKRAIGSIRRTFAKTLTQKQGEIMF